MPTKPPLQKFFKEFCIQKMKANKTMKGQSKPNHRRKDKESESNINLAAYNQTLKQQKQLNDRNHHILINISNLNGLNSPIKRHRLIN
jgi:hypothetical protein